MITREEIEAAFIRHANPTGTDHTPTPWEKAPPSRDYGYGIAEYSRTSRTVIANFQHEADRDLALYFVNAHAGMLAVMRTQADALDFIAKGATDPGLRDYAGHAAELARIYHEGFASMGETFKQAAEAPEAPS
jgi:hypothetical protein